MYTQMGLRKIFKTSSYTVKMYHYTVIHSNKITVKFKASLSSALVMPYSKVNNHKKRNRTKFSICATIPYKKPSDLKGSIRCDGVVFLFHSHFNSIKETDIFIRCYFELILPIIDVIIIKNCQIFIHFFNPWRLFTFSKTTEEVGFEICCIFWLK